jgi:hypothetical protein
MKCILFTSALLFGSFSFGQILQSNSRASKLETVTTEKIEVPEETIEIQSTRTSNIKKRKKTQNESPEILNSTEPVTTEKKIKQKP